MTEGSNDHLYFLAQVAFSDKRTNSTFLYMNFARMFERNPGLLQRGVYPSLARMTELFRRYEIALPVKEIRFFIERKRHLDELFAGDPKNIYAGVTTVTDLMRKLGRIGREHGITLMFPGAKSKIFCLLAMFLREYVVLDFVDVIPIDVWVQTVSAATGALEGEGRITNQVLERRIVPLMREPFGPYREKEGSTNAVWLLGKFGCTHCHRRDMSAVCPVYSMCAGPIRRPRHSVSGKHLGVVVMPPDFKGKYQGG